MLPVSFSDEAPKRFQAEMGEVQVVSIGAPPYEGEYTVTPKVEEQTLPTKAKIMKEDLSVKGIPVFNVSNSAGGSTFYIATMDDNPDGVVAILGKAKIGEMIL